MPARRLKYNYWSFKKNYLDIKKLHNFLLGFWTVMCYARIKQETLKKTKKRKCEPRMLYPTKLTFKHKKNTENLLTCKMGNIVL